MANPYRQALQALVDHARPAFPKSPYALALKAAREVLQKELAPTAPMAGGDRRDGEMAPPVPLSLTSPQGDGDDGGASSCN